MTEYKCFSCGKKLKQSFLRKKIRCPYCGSKILYKQRTTIAEVKAQ